MSCRKNPRNTVIIFQVSYGRDSEVCPYKPGKPFPFKQIFEGEGSKDPPGLRCEEDVTKMIDKRCGWKKACNVSVTSSVSDLCGPGANQYLSVAYSCGKAFSKVNTEVRLMLRELIMRKKTSLVLKFLGGLGGWGGAVTLLPEKNYKSRSTDQLYNIIDRQILFTNLNLKMTSAQVVETSVTNNSSFQNYPHPDDQTIRTTDTPGFKPFTKRPSC